MISRLASSVWSTRRFNYQTLQAYTLSHEAVERIKDQLITNQQARLVTLENTQSATTYKGLVVIAAGPFAKFTTLQRYSNLYLQEGFVAINIVYNKINFPSCISCDCKVDRIFDVLSSALTDSCPIVLKFYCSGSTSFLLPIMRRVSQPDCNLQISGIIFDSGPVYYDWATVSYNIYQMFRELAPHLNQFQKLIGTLCVLVFGLMSRKAKYHYFEHFVFNLNSILCTIPKLYIYSPADYIPVLSYLEKVIEEQKKYGAHVTTKVFPDSLHMKYLKNYPE